MMSIIYRLLIVLTTVYPSIAAPVEGKDKESDNENEVLKPIMEHSIATDLLEAYYYQTYTDSQPSLTNISQRSGNATESNSCGVVGDVPAHMRLSPGAIADGFYISSFYHKYTEAYGIPVVGSDRVSDKALSRACYVLRFLLADTKPLRNTYYQSGGRVAVMAQEERLRDLPEYTFLPVIYDKAIHGLGAIPVAPVSSAGEENILCFANDTLNKEDILLREIAQGILHLSLKTLDPESKTMLQVMYERAISSGWWKDTYAEHTAESYFGEGVQSYFSANAFAAPPDGYHNNINSRTKLMSYDPSLYHFVQRLFPCGNFYIKRCQSRGQESYQQLDLNCQETGRRNRRSSRMWASIVQPPAV